MSEEARERARKRAKKFSKRKMAVAEGGSSALAEALGDIARQEKRRVKRGGHYEFGHDHDVVFGDIAVKMRFVAGAGFVLGALSVIGTALQLAAGPKSNPIAAIIGLALSALGLAVAMWTYNASKSFRAITETSGGDIDHLMDALRALDKVYFIQCVFVAVGILGIAVVLMLFAGFLGGP